MTPYWSLRFFLGLNVLADACIAWTDPLKEVKAWGMLEDRCYASGPEVIRKRGGNPIDTLEQQARWLREKADNNIPVNAENPPLPEAPNNTIEE